MKARLMIFLAAILLLVTSGCSTASDENAVPKETQPEIPVLDNLEYWDIVQPEIVSMLNDHNLYVGVTTYPYPCVKFEPEPGVITEDGEIIASGLTEEEYREVFEAVKIDLYTILDKYKIGKPETIFHGCNSIVDIHFHNWTIDESKLYDNVYSRDVAYFSLDLLEYYYEHEENSYVEKDWFATDVWEKYPVYKYDVG